MSRINHLAPLWQKPKQLFSNFWQKREKREKMILLTGFCFVVVVGLYSIVWAPFTAYQSRVIQKYANFQGHIPYIARTLMTYQKLKQENQLPHLTHQVSLQSQISGMLVKQQLVPFGLKTKMLNPKQAVVSFKQVPFDALMTGVESLNKQAVFVIKTHINDVNQKGIVQGEITFSQFRS